MIAPAIPCSVCFSPAEFFVVLLVRTPAHADGELRYAVRVFNPNVPLCPKHKGWATVKVIACMLHPAVTLLAGVSFRDPHAHAEIRCWELWDQ